MWFSNLFFTVMVNIICNDDDLEISHKENMHKARRQPTLVLESLVYTTLSVRCYSKIVCVWLLWDLKKLNVMNARASATHGIYFKIPRSETLELGSSIITSLRFVYKAATICHEDVASLLGVWIELYCFCCSLSLKIHLSTSPIDYRNWG